MTFVDYQQTVEALSANRPDEPFGICIGSGRSPRGAQDLDAFGTEDLIEDGTEPLVPIVHQVLDPVDPVLSSFAQIPGDLGTPGRIGCPISHSSDEDPSGSQIDEEQHMERLQSQRLNDAWARMNWRHVSRFGGGRRLTVKIRRIEVDEICAPTFLSSPWIRR
jgi:hypothetical protein